MNSKNHSENTDEFNSLRTYFSQEIINNSNDLKKQINEIKSELKSEIKSEINEM